MGGPGWSPGWDDCVVFLGKTNSHSASLHPDVKIGICKFICSTFYWISVYTGGIGNILICYISWHFSCYSAPIHWLVHCHMTSNNETVSRQMPWACNIAKTMTWNRKQFTVTRKMLTAIARPLSITWLFVFHWFDPFALLYNKSLINNDLSLGNNH